MSIKNECGEYNKELIIRNIEEKLLVLKRREGLSDLDTAACVIETENVFGEGWNSSVGNKKYQKDIKYPGFKKYRVHAELKAIVDAYKKGKSDLSNYVMYVTRMPCTYAYCTQLLIQAKIKTVVYLGKNTKSYFGDYFEPTELSNKLKDGTVVNVAELKKEYII